MSVPFVDLRQQYHSVQADVLEAIRDMLDSTKYILGDHVRQFEEEVANYCGVRHAVGVNSGTDALLLALRAGGVGPGHEVITVANSFFATAEAIVLAGAQPRYVDIDDRTYLLDVSQLEAAITPRTRAIIPVHLYGQCADMDAIRAVARRHELLVIEDACQAIGAEYGGRKAGALGDAGCFSFVPAKNLGGYGDGGMVITNDDALANTVRLYRDHGSRKKYTHDVVGYNSRLDALQAVILRVKLRQLDDWNDKRRARAHRYTERLHQSGLITPTESGQGTHVYHLYVVRHPQREALMAFLSERGIASMIHYPTPIHRQPAFAEQPQAALPVTERLAPEIFSLPMFPEMTDSQVDEVVAAIHAFHQDHTPSHGSAR